MLVGIDQISDNSGIQCLLSYDFFCSVPKQNSKTFMKQGRSQDFQRGGRFFIEKGKTGSERCLRTFMCLFGTGTP